MTTQNKKRRKNNPSTMLFFINSKIIKSNNIIRKIVKQEHLGQKPRLWLKSSSPAFYNNNNNTIQQTKQIRFLSSSTPPPTWKQRFNESLNVPNTLTMIRLLSTPGLSYLIIQEKYVPAIFACFFTGILDWLDGYLARKWNQHTVLGSFLDPLADKVFVGTLFGTLTYQGLFPLPLAILVIGRDFALLGGSFIYRFLTKPKDVNFFATKGDGVIEVKPTMISRVNTVLQMSVIGFALTKAAFGIPNQIVFDGMCWIVGGTTLLSGLSYVNLKSLRSKSGL